MIVKDQPDCFTPNLLVGLSSIDDGTMLDRTLSIHAPMVVENRRIFCKSLGIDYEDVVYQSIVYEEGQTYDNIAIVDGSMTTSLESDIEADALFTKVPGVGLFLPVADCVATVVYDPRRQYLAMVHLGRESTVSGLMGKVIERFIQEGSSALDLTVWMSPSAKVETYVMQWFDCEESPAWQDFIYRTDEGIHLDLPGYNRAACRAAGIPEQAIHISPINTMTSGQYFSHSMGDFSGRQAVVAMIRG